jgi:PST family polysaccharide transporter
MLAKSATTSFSWNLAGSIVKFGASFVIGVVLARILGPGPFGLVALAMIFISIGNLIIDSGLNSGLVQKQEITNKDIQYVFSLQLGLGALISALMIGLAPLIAKLYHQPEVIPVLQALSITSLLQAASQTSTAILKRRLAFNRIQQVSFASYLLGYLCIGLPLALTRHGVWSLVFAELFQILFYLVFIYSVTRHSIGLVFRDPGGISRFGFNILGANTANWIIYNFDNTYIGWAFGAVNLGFYNRAWNLATTPIRIVVNSAQTVIFSASSKLQGSSERVREVFIGILILFGITIIPLSLAESLMATDLIQFVYGDAWHLAAPLLALLALAMPFYTLTALQGPVLAGLGKPQIEFKTQWVVVGFVFLIIGFANKSSMQMIVYSVLVVYIFRFVALSFSTFKVLNIIIKDIKSMAISVIWFSITVVLTIFITGQILTYAPILIRLLAECLVGIITWVLSLVISWKNFLPTQAKDLLSHYVPLRWKPYLDVSKVYIK